MMKYFIEVAGIPHRNKDGEERKDIVKKYLSDIDLDKIEVTLKRHGGNAFDRNAVGVYISTPGFFGCKDSMIGFVDRDQAKIISPMLKRGWVIEDASVTRVWLPDRSSNASPYVNIEVVTNWSEEDVSAAEKEAAAIRKSQRDLRKKAAENKKPIKISLFERIKLFFNKH